MQKLESRMHLGVVVGLAQNDAQGHDITGHSGVGAPKNSTNGKARLFRVKVGPMLKTAQQVPRAGEDSSPPNGSIVALQDMGDWLLMIAEQDDVGPDQNLNRGEKLLRATDGAGNKLARLKFKQNGKAYLGNATQNLGTQLDNLLVALNTFSGTAAQNAITAGGSTSAALAAAIVALMIPLFNSVVNCKTAIDALLDTSE